VILSVEMDLPFRMFLTTVTFSIKWPSSRIDEDVLQYLHSIPGKPTFYYHNFYTFFQKAVVV
jgi:hypothetical protein